MHHFGAKLTVFEDLVGGNFTGLQDILLVVHIVEKRIQRGNTLGQSASNFLPFFAGNDVRHDIKRNQALGAGGFAVNGKGDADTMKHQIGRLAILCDFFRRRVVQPMRKSGVLRTNAAVSGVHLVIKGFERH